LIGTFMTIDNIGPVVSIPGRTFAVEEVYLNEIIATTGYVLEPDSEYALHAEFDAEDGYSRTTGTDGSKGFLAEHFGGVPKQDAEGKVGSGTADADDWDVDYDDHSNDTSTSAANTAAASVVDRMDLTIINYELLEMLIEQIDSDAIAPTDDGSSAGYADQLDGGSILVFLPGMVEITKLHSALMSNPHFYKSDRFHVIPLHSSVAPNEQKKAFAPVPAGHRKIVLSTNIAETGVTIPDCVVVIDAGKVKEMQYRADGRMHVALFGIDFCTRGCPSRASRNCVCMRVIQ
jgi:ATP-dependent RNA helicase DHX29